MKSRAPGSRSIPSVDLSFNKKPITIFKKHNGINLKFTVTFKPEFINRLTDILVFKKLGHDALRKIVDIKLKRVALRARERELILKLIKPKSLL